MARIVMMKNDTNGLIRKGVYGYSWTYLFFGWLVPVFRGEIGIGALHFLISVFSGGIAQIIFSFLYNKQFTQRLIEKGFRFADRPEVNLEAAVAIGADPGISSVVPA